MKFRAIACVFAGVAGLSSGRYVCNVAAVSGGIPSSGAVSFNVDLTFGP